MPSASNSREFNMRTCKLFNCTSSSKLQVVTKNDDKKIRNFQSFEV